MRLLKSAGLIFAFMLIATHTFAQVNAREILIKSQQTIANAKAYYGEFTIQMANPFESKPSHKAAYITIGKSVTKEIKGKHRDDFQVIKGKVTRTLTTYDNYDEKLRYFVLDKKYLKTSIDWGRSYACLPDLNKGAYTLLGKRDYQRRKVFWIERVEGEEKQEFYIDCLTFLPLQVDVAIASLSLRLIAIKQNLSASFDESLLTYTPPADAEEVDSSRQGQELNVPLFEPVMSLFAPAPSHKPHR